MRRGPAIVLSAALVAVASTALADQPKTAAASATGAQSSPAPPLPSRSDELVAYVTRALNAHDIDAMDRLVEWQGARPVRRRMTLYQIRYNFGRPIKSVAVEPFPADGLQDAGAELNLKPNLPVAEELRVVFDEPAGPQGEVPASVFLIGREDGVYRISLLIGGGPPK